MILKCDTHTHTLYSRHAYSTIQENVTAAKERGLELLGMTDHYSSMLYPDYKDVKNYQYLTTSHELPDEWMGVRLLKGCEADIIDLEGHLFGYDIRVDHLITGDKFKPEDCESLLERVVKRMDYVIASVHGKDFAKFASPAQCTELYLQALEHPKVFILGHIGRSGLPIDVDEVLLRAKELHKLIEINEHSFDNGQRVKGNCREIAIRCAELNVPISVATDAHVSCDIGNFNDVPELLEEIHFPEELIMSRDKAHFLGALREAGLSVKD